MTRLDIRLRLFPIVLSLVLAVCVVFLSMEGSALLHAQMISSKIVRITVPFPPGGSADFFARIVTQKLGPMLGQPIVIENKPGAGGITGSRTVIGEPPDGDNLLVTSTGSLVIAPNLSDPPAFEPLTDFAPITPIGRVPALLVARPGIGIRTFGELIKYAKANPGKLNFASSGNGTVANLAIELLKRETGIDVVSVPYRGAPPAVNDLLGGQVDMMFSDAPFFIAHVKAGTLVPIVVGSAERIATLPDVPTTAEVGFPKIIADNTYCLFAPAHTPPETIQKLNALVLKVLEDPSVRQAFAQQNAVPAGESTERFKTFVRAEYDRWVPLAKSSGAKLE